MMDQVATLIPIIAATEPMIIIAMFIGLSSFSGVLRQLTLNKIIASFTCKRQENIGYGNPQRVQTTPTQAIPQQYPLSPNSQKSPAQSTAQYTPDHPHDSDR